MSMLGVPFASSASTAAGSNRRCTATVAPIDSAGVVSRFRPATWNMGVTVRTSSVAVMRSTSAVSAAWAVSAPCVSSAPLGVPVVPEVKKMSTGDDASTSGPGET